MHFDDAFIIRLVYKHSRRVNKGSDNNRSTAIQWPYGATRDELILAITSFYLCVCAGRVTIMHMVCDGRGKGGKK